MTRHSNNTLLCRLTVGVTLSFGAIAGCGISPIDATTPTAPVTRPVDPFGTGGFLGDGCPGTSGGTGGVTGGPTVFPGGFMTASSPVFDGIVMASDPPPPISGGTLIVLRDGVTAVAGDSDRDRVYVVSLSDSLGAKLRWSIALGLHDEPGRLVEDGGGMVHVVLRGSGSLATIDPAAGKITMRRALCGVPRGIAYDAAIDRLHVACGGGELLTFVPTAPLPERVLKVDQDLRDVVVDGSLLMISRFRSAEVIVLDAKGALVERIKPPRFANAVVHEASSFAPAVAWRMTPRPGGGAVMVHQRGMDGTLGTTTPGGYSGLSPCDSIVHGAMTMVRSGARPVASPAMPGFVLPVDVAVSSDGQRVATIAAGNGHAQFNARKLFVANVDDVTSEWSDGCNMDDVHQPSPSGQCRPVPAKVVPPLPDGTCPAGLFLCSGICTDQPASVCRQGAGGVSGTGETTGSGAASGTGGATAMGNTGAAGVGGAGGFGGSVGTAGGTGFNCSADLPAMVEPVSVAFAGVSQVLVQTREPAQLWIVSDIDGGSTSIDLSQESRADTGHSVFHSNSGGGLACASCHPEGHEDGRTWNFQCEGARRTQDISGGLSGTAPFHWGGDLRDFPTLVDTVFVGRMSGPRLTNDQTTATLHWIDRVPSKPGQIASNDPQVLRGKALFDNPMVGCATCHQGNALTNNQTVDVGTSGMFQVPSLRGVGWRAPYLHNGCAATLTDRFGSASCTGGDLHGKTSQMTQAQIGDLVAFLQSL